MKIEKVLVKNCPIFLDLYTTSQFFDDLFCKFGLLNKNLSTNTQVRTEILSAFQNVTNLTFFGLKSLVRMSLRGNDITHLAEGTFNQLSKVKARCDTPFQLFCRMRFQI
jgi:hypothetical protein